MPAYTCVDTFHNQQVPSLTKKTNSCWKGIIVKLFIVIAY